MGKFQPNLVFCNHLDTACYLQFLGWPNAVFDTHNCLSQMAIERARGNSPWSGVLRMEAARLSRLEAQICRRASLVLACSENDASLLMNLSGCKNFSVVPNGVDCEYYRDIASNARSLNRLVFVGKMSYLPNVEAAEWFCQNVFPALVARYPELQVQFVGADPSQRVQKLALIPGVVVTGRVPDVRPYLRGCTAVVVPLLQGGGTRLKILEAMAAGCPVVSTTKGVEGITCKAGDHLMVVENAQEMVDCLTRLLEDAQLRQTFSENALQVSDMYDWKSIGQKLLRDIGSIGFDGKAKTLRK